MHRAMTSQDGYSLSVGSLPKAFGYHGDEDEHVLREVKPRILLMGLRRSGKSSIQKVHSDLWLFITYRIFCLICQIAE